MPRVMGVVALAALSFVIPLTTPLGLAAMTTAVMAWETVAGRKRDDR